jgi:mannosyltransferase OCH1-like enzyme
MNSAAKNRPAIVQYWHDDPPPEVEELMDTWRSAAADGFEYLRYDDVGALDFIRTNHGQRIEEAYATCAVPAMKADLFRVCFLLIRPGLYADADMRCTGRGRRQFFLRDDPAPLLLLYDRLERGLLLKRDNRVANGFIIVKHPQDPLLRFVLASATDNIERRVSNNVYLVTGPGIATKRLRETGPQDDLFSGFEFWTEEGLSPYMRMVGKLPYKRTANHWVNAQSARSIFAAKSGSDR